MTTTRLICVIKYECQTKPYNTKSITFTSEMSPMQAEA
jgi:hypothetical protein